MQPAALYCAFLALDPCIDPSVVLVMTLTKYVPKQTYILIPGQDITSDAGKTHR